MKFTKKISSEQVHLNQISNKSNDLDIVCLSNQPWDFELWTNKKQIMTRVRDRGNNVLFVNPPLRLTIIDKVIKKRIKLSSLFSNVVESKGLSIYSPFRLTFKKSIASYNKFLEFFPTLLQSYLINKFFSKSTGKKVLWVYHVAYPGLELLLSKVNYDVLIYDSVDEYSEMPQFKLDQDKRWILNREDWLVKKADIIFTSAPGLYKKFKKIKSNTFYTPNAGSYELFSNLDLLPVPQNLVDIKGGGKKIVGFSGAIDSYKINVSLLCTLAKNYPNYVFVLLGPIKYTDSSDNVDLLKDYNNIKLLGVTPYENLPAYFKCFDAYIIPYNINSYTVGCFPTKFHDALASGLPTVITNLESIQPFSQVCYSARSDLEFVKLLQIAINENSDEKKNQRMQVASQNTWDQKLEK